MAACCETARADSRREPRAGESREPARAESGHPARADTRREPRAGESMREPSAGRTLWGSKFSASEQGDATAIILFWC